MPIFRIEKTKDYTTMSNYHLRDKKLSLKAKGLLSVMLSLPEDWDYSVRGLEKICIESKNTINSVLNELEKNGYLLRKKIYENGKIKKWEYVIYEKPQEKNLYPKNEDIENEDIENWDNNKYTKELNTKEYNINIVEQVINYMNELAGTSFKHTTKKTISLINARLKEGFTIDDLKDVIYYKYHEWFKEPFRFSNGIMSDVYYRPNTLFGTKFEEYLESYKREYK